MHRALTTRMRLLADSQDARRSVLGPRRSGDVIVHPYDAAFFECRWVSKASASSLPGLALAAAFCPSLVLAHADRPPAPHDVWATWTADPWVVVPIALMVSSYWVGAVRLSHRSHSGSRFWRHVSFASGVLALLVALVSPLDGLGDALFSAHMAQHMVLMLLAAPLLVAAQPLPILLHGLPTPVRRGIAAPVMRGIAWQRWGRWLIDPFVAGALQICVLLLWHAPALFIAAQRGDAVHTLMHVSLFGCGALYWWSVFSAASTPGAKPLLAAIVTLVTMKVSLMFALIMLSADGAFYPEIYAAPAAAWSTTALADQQLAAIVMLAPGAIIYLPTAFVLLWLWLRKMDGNSKAGRCGAKIAQRGLLEGDAPSRVALS